MVYRSNADTNIFLGHLFSTPAKLAAQEPSFLSAAPRPSHELETKANTTRSNEHDRNPGGTRASGANETVTSPLISRQLTAPKRQTPRTHTHAHHASRQHIWFQYKLFSRPTAQLLQINDTDTNVFLGHRLVSKNINASRNHPALAAGSAICPTTSGTQILPQKRRITPKSTNAAHNHPVLAAGAAISTNTSAAQNPPQAADNAQKTSKLRRSIQF